MKWKRNFESTKKWFSFSFKVLSWNFTYLVDQHNLENIFKSRPYKITTVLLVPYFSTITIWYCQLWSVTFWVDFLLTWLSYSGADLQQKMSFRSWSGSGRGHILDSDFEINESNHLQLGFKIQRDWREGNSTNFS